MNNGKTKARCCHKDNEKMFEILNKYHPHLGDCQNGLYSNIIVESSSEAIKLNSYTIAERRV